MWSVWTTASGGSEAMIARSVVSIALYGTLLYFLWKRSAGVRLFLGIAQVAGPLIYLLAELIGTYRMDLSTHFRMFGALVFGAFLLFWPPICAYTKKDPKQIIGA
jgi:hypothetical protein